MAEVALIHAAGIALPLLGVTLHPALPILGSLGALFLLFHRPWRAGALVAALVAGIASGESVGRAERRDCRLHMPTRWEGEIEGRFLTRPVPGSSLPFELVTGAPGGCKGDMRAILRVVESLPPAGQMIHVNASWVGRRFPQPGWGDRAGILRLDAEWAPVRRMGLDVWLFRLRGRVQQRVFDLWGEDLAPAAEALVLARREHLDSELREAFALSGTAHLLAISGFHVGVIAGLLVGMLRLVGVRRLRAEAGAVIGCWLYVLGIGAPHAAVRAGVLLSLLVAARFRGRPVRGTGVLGAALLMVLAACPGWLASVGFQLSFAGTAGLILIRGSVAAGFESVSRTLTGRSLSARESSRLWARLLRGGTAGVIAGTAATLATLPLIAWHFDRVSLVGIPATLLVAPVVAMAIPGIGSSLLLSLLPGGLGRFVAGGTGLLLEFVARFVTWISHVPGASVWIAREPFIFALLVATTVILVLRRQFAGKIRPSVRLLTATLSGATAVILLPFVPLRNALELHVIDVGQGDAVAIRFPSGRWMLVDAGPRSPNFDAGARRVVPYLRRQGADRLEAIALTHPHLDHIGGAPAVLEELEVEGILDPSYAIGSADYLDVLEGVQDAGSSWWQAHSGLSFLVDDARVTVVHPESPAELGLPIDDPNDLSIVLIIRWNDAAILLTGDAPALVERGVLDQLPSLTVLKVGHHGSRTSTSAEMLDQTQPRMAVIPVGDGNRFGHPHRTVLDRLHETGATVFRTDRDGDIRLIIRSDGTVVASSSR